MSAGPRRFWREAGLTLGALLLVSVPFWLTDLDLVVSSKFFSAERGWFLADAEPWEFLYRFGDRIAIVSFLLALVWLAVLGARKQQAARLWHALYLYMVLLLGPSLVCNSVFKEHWGRPRPASTTAFGGPVPYHRPWVRGNDSNHTSFPSGHAAAGFSFLAFYPLLRRRRRAAARACAALGILAGLLLGTARIVQGRHFLSDVLWSAGFVYLTALTCYHLLLDVPAREKEAAARSALQELRRPRYVVSVLLTALAALAGLLFSSYRAVESLTRDPPQLEGVTRIALETTIGSVALHPLRGMEQALQVQTEVDGLGWPGSGLVIDEATSGDPDARVSSYRVRRHGALLWARAKTRLSVQASLPATIDITTAGPDAVVTGDWRHTNWREIVLRTGEHEQRLYPQNPR